mgnify:CR=1 FL=1
MVGALLLTIGISGVHMAWSVGALPFFEGEGFVRQKQFTTLAADTKQARQNTLMVSITDWSCALAGSARPMAAVAARAMPNSLLGSFIISS